MAKTTSDLIVERLLDWGIDTCFGINGDQVNGFFESLRTHSDQMRFIHVRHEENAASPRWAMPSSPAASQHAWRPLAPARCICSTGSTTRTSTACH